MNKLQDAFVRTRLLFGADAMEQLRGSRVAVFGIGGVGGYVVEALTRSGIGALELIDHDTIDITNLNRQIISTRETVGRLKVDVAEERVHAINPEVVVTKKPCFYLPATAAEFDFSSYDYVVDAVDTVTAKIDIILRAKEAGVPVISSMGTGNKLDPSKLRIADLYETSMDPLSRIMRRELRKRGVKKLKVVYSPEPAMTPRAEVAEQMEQTSRRATPGSTSFVPPVAGMIIASEVVRDLTGVRGV